MLKILKAEIKDKLNNQATVEYIKKQKLELMLADDLSEIPIDADVNASQEMLAASQKMFTDSASQNFEEEDASESSEDEINLIRR